LINLIPVKPTGIFFVDIIRKYFPNLTDKQISQFEKLGALYSEWNEKINVISRKDIEQLYTHHVLHSLGIARVCEFEKGSRVMDVGTGGGFPGIPLAIMYPDSEFHLVDSIGKKITVVNEVIAGAGIENAKGFHKRAEEMPGSFQYVVSRAVTRMKPFYGWVQNKLVKDKNKNYGIYYLKGGDLEEELAELKRGYQIYELSILFNEPFFETKKVVYIPSR
jgi:16S rRNA (guanine527-N7)-methyltransferase